MATEPIRLQKLLAQAGVASRRAAEELIRQGRVAVNNIVVTKLGKKVLPGIDSVAVDGREVGAPEHLVYFALNKPAGYVSTVKDAHARRTVLDLVPATARLYPVGRLDADSEGLLLLTNDGALAFAVTHPSHELEKEYRVLVAGVPDTSALRQLRQGVSLEGRPTAPAQVEVVSQEPDGTWLRVVLHEGRKRQVRRMAEEVGHPVRYLQRVRIGPVRLGRLGLGQYRELTPQEVGALKGENGSGVSSSH